MKNLFLSLALLFLIVFTACQENSITNPITNENVGKDINYYNNLSSNTIKLNTSLLDPSQNPNISFQIIGTIEYGVSSNIGNQISANNAYNTIVKMRISAKLYPNAIIDKSACPTTPGYCIFKETVDNLNIDLLGQRENKLVKRYEITGCLNRICLQATFAVTTTKVILKDLKLCPAGSIVIDPEPIIIND